MPKSRTTARGVCTPLTDIMEPTILTVTSKPFDLDQFETVSVYKEGTFTPATDAQEALTRLGGDSTKLMEVINRGLKEAALDDLRNNDSPWLIKDADGNVSEYKGESAEEDAVTDLVRTLAKTVYGFDNRDKNQTREQKREMKEKALGMIRDTPAIRNGLVERAKLAKAQAGA